MKNNIKIEEFLESLKDLIFGGIFYKESTSADQVCPTAVTIDDEEKSLSVYLSDGSGFLVSVSEKEN